MNPEIQKYNDKLEPGDAEICNELAPIIDVELKDAESKIWHAHPVWFLDGNPIVGYSKLKDSIRLMFWSGQSFATEGLAPSGKFKAAERLFRDSAEIDDELLHAWLGESRNTQWDYKNIVKRRGRLERIS